MFHIPLRMDLWTGMFPRMTSISICSKIIKYPHKRGGTLER